MLNDFRFSLKTEQLFLKHVFSQVQVTAKINPQIPVLFSPKIRCQHLFECATSTAPLSPLIRSIVPQAVCPGEENANCCFGIELVSCSLVIMNVISFLGVELNSQISCSLCSTCLQALSFISSFPASLNCKLEQAA